MQTVHCARALVLLSRPCGIRNIPFGKLQRENLVLYGMKMKEEALCDPVKPWQQTEGLLGPTCVISSVLDRLKATGTIRPAIHGQRNIASLGFLRRLMLSFLNGHLQDTVVWR